jgi:GT2 family glycosyltransferase
MDVSIVIVNTNTRELLKQCIDSILDNTTGLEYEIIVVDNHSADGSSEMITAEFPSVRLIQNDSNLGFPASNNRGFAVSSGRYVLALNPDTVVLGDALSSMVSFMDEHAECGACGCKLLNGDGSLQPSWENFPSMLSEIFYETPLNRIFPHRKRRKSNGAYDVDWVSGACLMVRRQTLEEVGVFDERFSPIYSEETDWCYRIKAGGWKIYYVPEPEIIHLSGQTTKKKPIWFYLQLQRSKYLFFRKHRGVLYAETYRFLRIVICAVKLCLDSLRSLTHTMPKDSRSSCLKRNRSLLKMFLDPHVGVPATVE